MGGATPIIFICYQRQEENTNRDRLLPNPDRMK
jgi:hypothetical protein